MRITRKWLEAHGIKCKRALEWFERTWPRGCFCTRANCLKVARKKTGYLLLAVSPVLHGWATFADLTQDAYTAWREAGMPRRGKLREALAQADAEAFWTLAKGVLR